MRGVGDAAISPRKSVMRLVRVVGDAELNTRNVAGRCCVCDKNNANVGIGYSFGGKNCLASGGDGALVGANGRQSGECEMRVAA